MHAANYFAPRFRPFAGGLEIATSRGAFWLAIDLTDFGLYWVREQHSERQSSVMFGVGPIHGGARRNEQRS